MKKSLPVVVGLVLASVLLGSAGTANAEPHQVYKCTQIDGGIGCYEATGDYISASDTGKDGAHVQTSWYIPSKPSINGYCENYRGYGTRQTCQESKKIPEHVQICFFVSVIDGKKTLSNSPPKCLPTTAPANPT